MYDFSIPVILSAFTLIFLVELPDKTALATIALATKHKAKDVLFGVWLAFVVQTFVGILFGKALLLLPAQPVHIAAGLGFIIFAVFILHSDEAKEMEKEEKEVEKYVSKHRAWTASFLVIFASEWGDLSQLATAALVARTGKALSVGIGSLAALMAVSFLAVLLGTKIKKLISPEKLHKASAYIFIFVGLVIIALTFYPIKGL